MQPSGQRYYVELADHDDICPEDFTHELRDRHAMLATLFTGQRHGVMSGKRPTPHAYDVWLR